MDNNFQTRIEYQGPLKPLLERVCADYGLGHYSSHEVVVVGYEDFNVVLTTSQNKYFVKIFADFRNEQDCNRYVRIIQIAINAGVAHPAIYKSNQNKNLYQTMISTSVIRLCVFQFIEGKTFYALQTYPTLDELRFLAQQASVINQIKVNIEPVYDSWAVVNFASEFNKAKHYLSKEDLVMVKPLVEEFLKIDLKQLPHYFVHGDIIKTNVIRSTNGQLYILDFSVANYYPRIQELAVLFCDLFFNEKDPSDFKNCYETGLSEYQKNLKLTDKEISLIPLYTKAAHAMHILCPSYEREVNNNYLSENNYWLELGRAGLRFSQSHWHN